MKFYIGGVVADKSTDFVEADFVSQVWTEVDGWSQAGAIGDTAQLITTALINRGRDAKQKGTSNAGSMQNVFAIVSGDAGQTALLAAAKPSNKNNYAFKMEGNDASAPKVLTGVSMTAASPGIATKVAHALAVDTPIKFTAGSGTLPTGVTDGTTYFVKTVPSADTFTVSATKGGVAIVTTGSPTGTYTVTTVPMPSQRLFIGIAMSAEESNGEANTIRNLSSTIEINSNIVPVAAT